MFRKKSRAAGLLLAALLMFPASCAKSPPGTSNGVGTQIVVTVRVAGEIRPDYFYSVLFNINNTAGQGGLTGPVPVVAPPYYNGFAVGAFDDYVEYNGSLPNNGYELFSILSDLQTPVPLGKPISVTAVPDSGNTIQFSIALSQLATTAIPVGNIQNLEINIIATNVVPVASDTPVSKNFDALGNPFTGGVNDFITITNLTTPATYDNAGSATPEAAGDVATEHSAQCPILIWTSSTTPSKSAIDPAPAADYTRMSLPGRLSL
jgi:hypothetical protein